MRRERPFPQLLSVYRSADVTGLTSGATSTVLFDVEEIDSGGAFDTSTGYWTPPRGAYIVGTSVGFYSGSTCVLTRVAPTLMKNGSAHKYFGQLDVRSGASAPTFWQYYGGSPSMLIIANGTDVFRVDAVATTVSGTWAYVGGAAFTFLSAFQVA